MVKQQCPYHYLLHVVLYTQAHANTVPERRCMMPVLSSFVGVGVMIVLGLGDVVLDVRGTLKDWDGDYAHVDE
jgi:hypothetical protein